MLISISKAQPQSRSSRPGCVNDKLTKLGLYAVIAIPFLYFGLQVVAAPFYPGYSFLKNVASDLGSDKAPNAAIFNVGIMAFGVIVALSSFAFLSACYKVGVNKVVTWLAFVALLMNGLTTVWAGYFPLPDPRHGGHPSFVIFMLLMPLSTSAVVWRWGQSVWSKVFVVATILLLLFMVGVFSGALPVNLNEMLGLRQRLFVLAGYPIVSIAGYVLLRRLRGVTIEPHAAKA